MNLSKTLSGGVQNFSGEVKISSNNFKEVPKGEVNNLIVMMDNFHANFGDNAEIVTIENKKTGYKREIRISKHSITIYSRENDNTKTYSFGIKNGKVIITEMSNIKGKKEENNIDINKFIDELDKFIGFYKRYKETGNYELSIKQFGDRLYEEILPKLREKFPSFPNDLVNSSAKITVKVGGKSTDLIIGANEVAIDSKGQGRISMIKNDKSWEFHVPDSGNKDMSPSGKREFLLSEIRKVVDAIYYGNGNCEISVDTGEPKWRV